MNKNDHSSKFKRMTGFYSLFSFSCGQVHGLFFHLSSWFAPGKLMIVNREIDNNEIKTVTKVKKENARSQHGWFAREVKGEDLRSSAHKCAWVRTP